VDFYTGARRNDKWNRPVKPLYGDDDESKSFATLPSWKGKGKALDAAAPSKVLSTTIDGSVQRPNETVQEVNKAFVTQDDTNLVLMCPMLHAFSLRTRKWSEYERLPVQRLKLNQLAFSRCECGIGVNGRVQ
jgi:hypothetical protein